MTPESIQLISFDLDDTLWNGTEVILKAERAMLDWMQQHTPFVLQQNSPEQLRKKKIQFAKQHPHMLHKVSTVRKQFLLSLFSEAGYGQADTLAEQCFQAFYQARQNVILFENVLETLDLLNQQFRVIALTNGNADLSIIGLEDYFEFCLSAEDFSAPKPASDMFDYALQRTALLPQQCLHVGDHPTHDMLGAHKAGWKTCWLNDGSRQWEHAFDPNMEITHIQELLSGAKGA